MLDDADKDAPEFDPPDPEGVYRNYVATCRRLGVEPVPRLRAQALLVEWSAALAAATIAPRPSVARLTGPSPTKSDRITQEGTEVFKAMTPENQDGGPLRR